MQALNGFQVEDHQTWQVVPLGIREVKVTDLLYSQTSISDHFQDGSPIHRLVADLKSGTVHPLQLRPLRVIDWPGRGLVTLDHRRVWCLKRFQEQLRETVHVKVDIYQLPGNLEHLFQIHPVLNELMRKYYTRGSGLRVNIRRRR